MALTLDQLLAQKTQSQWLATLLAYLAPGGLPANSDLPNAPGLPVTDWNKGGVANTIVQIEAQALADLETKVRDTAAGGFLDFAPDNTGLVYTATPFTPATATDATWLDLIANQFFNVTRGTALATQGLATLTLASGLPAVSITAGALWMVDAAGHRYNNIGGGTLTAAAPLALSWQAETPGTDWNVPLGTVVTLQTPIPGVTVALTETPPSSGTWVTRSGVDLEHDDTVRQICRLKWAIVAGNNAKGGATVDAYKYWALRAPGNAAGVVAKAFVLTGNPDGPGTLRVYVAPPTGAFASDVVPEVLNVDSQIQLVKPETALVGVHHATALAITLAGTVNYFTSVYGSGAAAAAAIGSAITALATALQINDTVYWTRVLEAIMAPATSGPYAGLQGVRNVAGLLMNGSAADIDLSAGGTLYRVASFTVSLTFTGV